MSRIVETDNCDFFGPPSTPEKFLDIPPMPYTNAQLIADTINAAQRPDSPRYWRVVDDDYELAG